MLRTRWLTITGSSRVTLEEKRSVFIASATPVRSAGDAERFVASIRAEFPDARHHVYAWRVTGDEFLQRYSDDGEPTGTAGLPVLDVLRKNEIEDAAIVVVRYFGGTLLGTGGLVRAYGRSAAEALTAAHPTYFQNDEEYRVLIGYDALDRVRYLLEKKGFATGVPEYGIDPVLRVFAETGRAEELKRLCLDATSGDAIVEYVGMAERAAESMEANIDAVGI